MSESEFAARANAACRAFERERLAIIRPTNEEAVAAYFQQVLPVVEAGISKLAAIAPPASGQGMYTKMLTLARKDVGIGRALVQELGGSDTATLQRLRRESEATESELERLARELKIEECFQETEPNASR